MTGKKTLKAQNLGWIWTVVLVDALALAAMAFPSSIGEARAWLASTRLVSASLAPLVVLLLTSLLSSDLKAILVFWRVRDVLPAHRAFSELAPRDPRIDLQRLLAAVGPFPTQPHDQNAAWYRLMKKVEADPIVAEPHRYFLLFRDLAALSLLLLVFGSVALLLLGAAEDVLLIGSALFGLQYVATAIAARHHGVRLVCNVLALHGAADPSTKKRGARRTAASAV